MTRRVIQQQLVTRNWAAFAREASRLNVRAADGARAEHERHGSILAATYRVSSGGRREPGERSWR
jgi:hypothetical protein